MRLACACVLIVVLRVAIAGADVVTSLSGSQLLVTGDSSPDAIEITSTFDGLAVTGVDGTLVDGSLRSATFPGVQRLTVKLKEGGDRITVSNVTLSGKLYIGGGKGDDDVELDEVVAGAVRVQTNKGNDAVRIFGPSYFDSLTVQTGSGSDLVVVDWLDVGGDLDVLAGDGDDVVEISGVNVYDDLDVHLDHGNDFMSLGDASIGDDTHLDGGDEDDNGLVLYGYLWFGDELDIDDFGDDDWWW
jgi:large repetitive protein